MPPIPAAPQMSVEAHRDEHGPAGRHTGQGRDQAPAGRTSRRRRSGTRGVSTRSSCGRTIWTPRRWPRHRPCTTRSNAFLRCPLRSRPAVGTSTPWCARVRRIRARWSGQRAGRPGWWSRSCARGRFDRRRRPAAARRDERPVRRGACAVDAGHVPALVYPRPQPPTPLGAPGLPRPPRRANAAAARRRQGGVRRRRPHAPAGVRTCQAGFTSAEPPHTQPCGKPRVENQHPEGRRVR